MNVFLVSKNLETYDDFDDCESIRFVVRCFTGDWYIRVWMMRTMFLDSQ